MVITCHFLDKDCKLNKWVLNFVHVPPPHRGIDISDALYKCFQEWDIENKIYSISMDNASANDKAIKNLRRIFEVDRKLLCDGRLFHVRCCAHILNLIAQDGLETIKSVIKKVRESISFINASEARTKTFNDLAQQMKLPNNKLILDCKTRWNSTYEMLVGAYKFKEVFPKYEERDPDFDSCPLKDDWVRVEQICEILEVFNNVTHIISGSDYPTSNLFLCEVYKVKQVLDGKKDDESEFIRKMVEKMKEKFDKYWAEVHLLMAIAAVLDPRVKMWSLEFIFPKIYNSVDAKDLIKMVEQTLRSLHSEYVTIYNESTTESSEQNGSFLSESSKKQSKFSTGCGFQELQNFVRQNEASPTQKSDLDVYFEDGCYMCALEDSKKFNILDWWKNHESKYRILSKLAHDILAIPITTVASEATFSAGSRVIDQYRAKLGVDTVQALLCGENWMRNIHGVKSKKSQVSY
ncbi:zinc finger BED domain-containing protein RICESLEEPER 2-like protein [Tanacetum coccineum]